MCIFNGNNSPLGRSPGERNDNPLQNSCLGNPMHRGAWWATVYGVERVGHDLVTKQQHRPLVKYGCTHSFSKSIPFYPFHPVSLQNANQDLLK